MNDSNERRARKASVEIPQQLCSGTVLSRQLEFEIYGDIASTQDPVYGTVAQSPPELRFFAMDP